MMLPPPYFIVVVLGSYTQPFFLQMWWTELLPKISITASSDQSMLLQMHCASLSAEGFCVGVDCKNVDYDQR